MMTTTLTGVSSKGVIVRDGSGVTTLHFGSGDIGSRAEGRGHHSMNDVVLHIRDLDEAIAIAEEIITQAEEIVQAAKRKHLLEFVGVK